MRLLLVIFAVEALVASWIEIAVLFTSARTAGVEALVASWIEIEKMKLPQQRNRSKPLWLRGLKCLQGKPIVTKLRRSPCGFVD